MLSNEKTRRKITWEFSHCGDLDWRFASQISPNQQNMEGIYKILKAKGAGENCYIIAKDSDIDEMTMNLKKAVDKNAFGDGVFLSCIAGKLLFYSSDEQSRRYILERK